MEQRYRQLTRRLVLTALAVALIPLYLVGAAIYLYFTSVQEENHKAELRTLAVNRAAAIQLFLAERTGMLEALAHAATPERLTAPGELQGVLRLLNRRRYSFLDLGVIDEAGNHLAYVGPFDLQDRKYGDAPWFEETLLRGGFVSDVFLGFRGVPHFIIAIKNDEGPRPWILRATIDSDVFSRLVAGAQLGTTGDAYIINRAGVYQTPPRFGGALFDRCSIDLSTVPPGVSVIERRRPDGKKVLTAFSRLAEKDWVLVVDRDPREPLASLRLARNLELVTLLFATLLISGAVLFHVRLLVRRLEQQDRQRVAVEAQLAHSARLVSLGRMAAGVAHEINNPLAAIGELAGLMDDLIDERFLQSSQHGSLFADNVRKIQEHVERARTVTHRLLGFARRMEPRHDTINVNDVVQEAVSFIEREATFRGVAVTYQLDPQVPLIKSDRAQLQQVFLNLLNNALDAVQDDGNIVVTSRVRDGDIEVAIADNGPGIPKEIRTSIFDPFFTTKGPGEGTGLGLSISHSIMQQLAGSLSFDTEMGKGTTFRVRVPRTAV